MSAASSSLRNRAIYRSMVRRLRHWFSALRFKWVLDANIERVGIGYLLICPIAEFHQEDQLGHRIQFFGGPPRFRTNALLQFIIQREFESGRAKQLLPAAGESWIDDRRKELFEHIEQWTLSRGVQILHTIASDLDNRKTVTPDWSRNWDKSRPN